MAQHFCGIVGRSGDLDPGSIDRAVSAFANGPDYSLQMYRSGPLALMHWSTGGHSVLVTEDAVVAADLEAAYWHDDARAHHSVEPDALLSLRYPTATPVLDQIDGEFSAVVWDQHRETLMLIRDRMGTRPLYYAETPDRGIVFATFLPCLLATGLIERSLDRDCLAKLSVPIFATGANTVYRSVRRVMPAEILCWSGGQLSRQSYWQLRHDDPISATADAQGATDHLQGLLRRAVSRLLPEDQPAFGHVSGGLDSSSVAAIAAESRLATGLTVRGYAFRALEPSLISGGIDEGPEIAALGEAYPNIDIRDVPSSGMPAALLGPLDATLPVVAFGALGEPCHRIFSDARAHGATRLFSGWGGDEGVSFPGHGALAEMFVAGRWGAMWRLAQLHGRRVGGPAWRAIASELRRYVLPPRFPGARRQHLVRGPVEMADAARFLHPDLRAAAVGAAIPARADTRWLRVQRATSGHIGAIQEELSHYAAQAGLAYVSPLLDRSVLEFAVRLPPEFLIRGGRRRALMRDAMAGLLPDQVRFRSAKLLPDPGEGVRIAAAKSRLLDEVTGLAATPAAEMFDLGALEQAVRGLETPQALKAKIVLEATHGRQYAGGNFAFARPLQIARFVAMHQI